MADTHPVPILPFLVATSCLAYGIYSFLYYPLVLHPLRRIPRAHWSVAYPYIGSLWILYQRYCERGNNTTYKAHLRSGSVIRVGYNELSINCVDDGIRTIYGGGWEKHEWYARQFAGFNVINMFSTVHHTPHSQKKRALANIYSKANIQASTQIKSNSHYLLTTRFLPLLQSLSDSKEPVDVHELNNALAMDFVSAYQFGIGRSTNFTQNVEMRHKVMHLYHSRRNYEWHSAEVAPWLRRWMKKLHIPFVPAFVADANAYLENWCSDMCLAAERYIEQYGDDIDQNEPGDEPVVYKYFKDGISKLRIKNPDAGRELLPHIIDPTPFLHSKEGLEMMSTYELRSEMMDHLGAGHETSAVCLTYLYWELCKHPDLQDLLHKELQDLEPRIQWPRSSSAKTESWSLPDPKSIDSLPFLNAIVMETLRLHAPIPGIEPRVSPHIDGGSKLGSFTGIPGGVRVSSTGYALHRNAKVFPDPERFDPTRWLISDEEHLREMHRWFWAFGSGGRMCIGSHLARQEIKLLVAAIYTNWTMTIVDDEGIEELDVYTTRPRSNKLILKLTHR